MRGIFYRWKTVCTGAISHIGLFRFLILYETGLVPLTGWTQGTPEIVNLLHARVCEGRPQPACQRKKAGILSDRGGALPTQYSSVQTSGGLGFLPLPARRNSEHGGGGGGVCKMSWDVTGACRLVARQTDPIEQPPFYSSWWYCCIGAWWNFS